MVPAAPAGHSGGMNALHAPSRRPACPGHAGDGGDRARALAGLLREAARSEAELLYPLFAALLDAHMGAGHADAAANARIRDRLDEIELLLALEIERAGLSRALAGGARRRDS